MKIDFNDNWTFSREGGEPCSVTLPHDAMITEPRRASAIGGTNNGYFPGGIYLYEKRFTVSNEDLGKSFVLHFEGVYQNAAVSLNGREITRHRYGFTPFDADLGDAVKAGENLISVRVENHLQPNCRWYTGSGIYRPVSLLIREKEHVEVLRVRTVSAVPAVIAVEADAETVEVFDGETRIASGRFTECSDDAEKQENSGAAALRTFRLEIPDAKLWSAETPVLYTLIAKKKRDERRLKIGIRELKWDAKCGLTVNGSPVKLRGGCIHHDHGVLGAREYRESELRRLTILKENGFNAIRIAHNPASQITLDLADEIGLYVLDECFDGWYTPKTYHDYSRQFWDHWKEDAAAMVESARNHPSVILYSIGNEVTETAEARGVKLTGEMRDHLRSLDPTRPVTAGINVLLNVQVKRGRGIYRDSGEYLPEPLPEDGSYKEKRSGSKFFNYWTEKLGWLFFTASKGRTAEKIVNAIAPNLDVVGLNYAASRYDRDAAKYPERLMLGTETMAGDLPYNWPRVLKYPQLFGDFVWAAWDYLGETCMGWTYRSYPGLPLLSGQGMIDITGLPLAQMAFMQVVWGLRKAPYIAVRPVNHAKETPVTGAWQFTNALPSWTWQGYEGTKATVEVYSDAAKIRLSLNGRTVKTRKVRKYKALFRLRYAPGDLVAEAMDKSGRVCSISRLSTGGAETVLCVLPEKPEVQPGEVFFVPVEFTDPSGGLKPYVEEEVTVHAENAELLGFGSALTKTDEVFDKNRHRTYRGRALAVFRAGNEGEIRITAAAKGYPEGEAAVRIAAK